jgi:hypothetical protein
MAARHCTLKIVKQVLDAIEEASIEPISPE